MSKQWRSLGMLVLFIALGLGAGQLGTFFTSAESFAWYSELVKPSWTPPDFIFPLAWTFLYVLIGLAAWLVWYSKKPGYEKALGLWVLQLIFNALWTPIFFGLQAISHSLIVIDLLWIFTLITMIVFYRYSRFAAFLMFIYALWLTYAGVLNFMLWRMNS